jgi:hypothetical protein
MRTSVTICDAEILKGNINSVPLLYAIWRSDIKCMLVLKFKLRLFYITKNSAITSARIGSARPGSARFGSHRLSSSRLRSDRLGLSRLVPARLGELLH